MPYITEKQAYDIYTNTDVFQPIPVLLLNKEGMNKIWDWVLETAPEKVFASNMYKAAEFVAMSDPFEFKGLALMIGGSMSLSGELEKFELKKEYFSWYQPESRKGKK